jgi:hypothetical protein
MNPFDYDNVLENPGFNVPATTTQGTRVNGKADAAFSYYSVITGDSSSYGIFPPVGTTAPGANSRGLGLGILHSF